MKDFGQMMTKLGFIQGSGNAMAVPKAQLLWTILTKNQDT